MRWVRCQPGDGVCAIWIMDADGTHHRALTPYQEDDVVDFWPSVSPDGSTVAFTRFGYRGFNARLTANPVEFVQHFTGDWTLRFLLITLSITPLRKLLNLHELIRFRRMLGLFAFFYVCLHFLTYIGPDQSDVDAYVERNAVSL